MQLFVDFSKTFDSIYKRKMEQVFLSYGLCKETVTVKMMLYRNTKVKVRSLGGSTKLFNIVIGVLQKDTLASYLLIICLDCIIRMLIDLIKENGFTLEEARSRILIVCLFGFYGISTFVGYLLPNSFLYK